MSYTIDKTEQLVEAQKRGYSAQARALRAQGVPLRQHQGTGKKVAAKKTTARRPKEEPTGRTAKKVAAKKTSAKKSVAKKTTTKKS